MRRFIIISILQLLLAFGTTFAQQRAMTFEDVMQFKSLSSQQMENGSLHPPGRIGGMDMY